MGIMLYYYSSIDMFVDRTVYFFYNIFPHTFLCWRIPFQKI